MILFISVLAYHVCVNVWLIESYDLSNVVTKCVVYVCMRARMYVCNMHVCMCSVRVYVCCVHACMRVCMYVLSTCMCV